MTYDIRILGLFQAINKNKSKVSNNNTKANSKSPETHAESEHEIKLQIKKLEEQLINLKQKLKSIQKNPNPDENQNLTKIIQPIENIDLKSFGNFEQIEVIGNDNRCKYVKISIQNFYILKEMNDKNSDVQSIQRLVDEFEIMNMLKHPNIIKAFRIYINDKNIPPSILLEYCPMNLDVLIKTKKLSKVQQVFYIYQIAEGMKYIHSRKIIHQNLKTTNILISENGTIKICGFEKSKKIQSKKLSEKEQLKMMSDVNSFGVIMYFILSGGSFPKVKNETVLTSFPLVARKMIEFCWSSEFDCRPTFDIFCEVLQKNNFDLISLSQQEIQEVSRMINQFNSGD